jgi:hypothetical protein
MSHQDLIYGVGQATTLNHAPSSAHSRGSGNPVLPELCEGLGPRFRRDEREDFPHTLFRRDDIGERHSDTKLGSDKRMAPESGPFADLRSRLVNCTRGASYR